MKSKHDWWLIGVVAVASVVSIGATIYYLNKGETLLYNDAYAHLLNARIFMDSLTPGISQISNVWLPLQHVLMFPLIWNDYLWRSGLAGTIPSMVSYVVATSYLFCALRKLTGRVSVSLIGATIFLINPNILYLQTTPLTEVMCSAGFISTTYYLVCWFQSHKQKHLMCMAVATVVTTLIRYDGWALFLVVTTAVFAIFFMKKGAKDFATDKFMFYLSVAPLGILSWLLWNKRVTGDLLYFQHSQYSAQAQQVYFLQSGQLVTYHNIFTSFQVYLVDVGQTIGWGFFVLSSLSLIFLFFVYHRQRECFILAIMVVSFVFYVITMYSGSSIIQLPGIDSTTFYNVRYGAQMVVPEAFLIAWALSLCFSQVHRMPARFTYVAICVLCIGAQSINISMSGILSLQDGLTGRSCINVKEPIILSLSQHYNGGRILVDNYTSDINPELFNTHFSNIIYEGSGSYWKSALVQPARFADWIVVNPYNPSDTLSKFLTTDRESFLSSFKLISSDPNGLQLYHRIEAPSFPTRPIPDNLLDAHTCRE